MSRKVNNLRKRLRIEQARKKEVEVSWIDCVNRIVDLEVVGKLRIGRFLITQITISPEGKLKIKGETV